MKIKIIILLFISIVVISCETNSFFVNKQIRVKDQETNNVNNIDLDEYVIGVVGGEMPASFHKEALKVQAILARTYAYYKIEKNKEKDYDVYNSINDQSYKTKSQLKNKWQNNYNKYYDLISSIVNETKDIILTSNNKVIKPFYYSISNGYTEDSQVVFNETKDYIQSVASPWDKEVNKYELSTIFSLIEFKNKLNIKNNIIINEIVYSNTHHVEYIIINNAKYTGIEFRKKLNLRSTDFDITINNQNVIIKTRGYGHGVGLSQYGANYLANNNYKYDEIINYYYKNINISRIN